MRQVTASRLALAFQCTYPWTSGHEWAEQPSASSRLGNAVHALAERATKGQPADPTGVSLEFSLQPAQHRRLTEIFSHWERWSREALGRTTHAELAFAVDPETGSVSLLEQRHHRDYAAAPSGAFCGTADVVNVSSAGHTVLDYKTGVWVEHPADSWQMRFLALAASRHYGVPRIRAEIVRLTTDGVHVIPYDFDALELAVVDSELHELHLRLKMADGPNPSVSACRFCPIRHTCKANVFAEPKDSTHA